MKKLLFSTAAAFLLAASTFAAITTNINSYYPLATGPGMPFPQFFDRYPAGGQANIWTLGDSAHQPDGLSHMEMERYIGDAYKIMSNRWAYQGTAAYQLANGAAGNVQMINDQASCDCSEGDGYALLAAALMADKAAFDGLWFWLMENNRVMNAIKYSNNALVPRPQQFGQHYVSVYAPPGDSATDGDMDIAMALLIAWRQWGDFSGYYAAGGHGPETNTNGLRAIKYKDMALAAIRYLVALDVGDDKATQPRDWITGVVGFDGYHKGGNTQNENTGRIPSPNGTTDNWDGPYGWTQGPAATNENFYDYTGPGYWRAFSNALIANAAAQDLNDTTNLRWNGTPFGRWNVDQLERVAASDFWLQGQLYLNYPVPLAGYYNAFNTNATFAAMNEGEDFRSIWRHAMDYLFYGNPPANQTWNPQTLAIDGSTPNNYEYLAANKLSNFLEDTAGTRCKAWGSYGLTFKGAAEIRQGYDLNGGILGGLDNHINFVMGSASPAVLISQRFPFMESWLRELFVTWDSQTINDGYLTSVPVYFHGWFRLLGLLMMSGNYVHPDPWQPKANMKVYKAINKTYGFTGDTITYWLNYRNYGSVNASGVTIRDTIPAVFEYISATGTHSVAGQVVSWNIGPVPGLTSQNYSATQGGVTLVVRVRDGASGKFCNTADIACTNGTGWRSNDQPNENTYITKTNCIDIVDAALTLDKSATNHMANPGDTLTYTLNYCNSSTAGWINGGRWGVTFSIAEHPMTQPQIMRTTIRADHQATEPWIDWSNYRISYFLNSTYRGVYNAATNPTGWNVETFMNEGTNGLKLSAEDLVPGCDGGRCWNQRLIVGFEPSITEPTHLLHKYFNNNTYLHYPGGFANGMDQPLAVIVGLSAAGFPPQDWSDDWSKLPTTGGYTQKGYGSGEFLYPISPDWTKGDGTSTPIDRMNKDACNGINPPIENILIEEFDGYTWRRVFGNGPQPGRQVQNVVLIDSLPTGLTFRRFIEPDSTTKTVSGRTITVNAGNMLVNQCKTLSYEVTVDGSCPGGVVNPDMINVAFISATNESPVADSWIVSATCAYVPPPPPPPSSVTKTASTSTVMTGQNLTYTIAYTNLRGSVANSLDASQNVFTLANWTRRFGQADWNFNGTDARANGGNTSIMTHNYSRGQNGTIELRVNMQEGQDFGVVVRQTGGTAVADGIYVRFRYAWDGTRIQVYNGTALLGAEKIDTPIQNADIKIVLDGGLMSIFVKNQTDPNYQPSASHSVSGVPIRTGWAGITNGTIPTFGNWSGATGHIVSRWRTELDSAFGVIVNDPLPAGLGFVSAANGGTFGSGNISWPAYTPYMDYGQSLTYSWVAQADGSVCGPLVNTAQVLPRGVTYTVADQVSIDVNCSSSSPTFTPTRTRTPTPTASPTPSPTATPTLTRTPTPSATPSPSPSPTSTATPTPSATPSPSATATATPTATASPTATGTRTATSTITFTITPSDDTFTNTPTITQTHTNTPTSTNTPSPSSTYSATPTATATSSATPSITFTITPSDDTFTVTPTITQTHTFTQTATPSATSTATPSATPTYSATPTSTGTPTATPSATESPVFTPTVTPTASPTSTATPTFTASATASSTPTASFTFTATPSYTDTMSPTPTRTATGTATITYTFTETNTQTATPTDTATRTATPSITMTHTDTPTPLPSPVDLDIRIETSGEEPKRGAKITYAIIIENNGYASVSNIKVWDELPPQVKLSYNNFSIEPVQTGSTLTWDVSHDHLGNPVVLEPGQMIRIEFVIEILDPTPDMLPLINRAFTDYNDPYYVDPARHPPVASEVSFYPIERPVVFPNPFSLSSNSTVKFSNIVPGSHIQIFTISGEGVISWFADSIRQHWDGKNRYGNAVSPGIYYFVIRNFTSGKVVTGKLYVVKE